MKILCYQLTSCNLTLSEAQRFARNVKDERVFIHIKKVKNGCKNGFQRYRDECVVLVKAEKNVKHPKYDAPVRYEIKEIQEFRDTEEVHILINKDAKLLNPKLSMPRKPNYGNNPLQLSCI